MDASVEKIHASQNGHAKSEGIVDLSDRLGANGAKGIFVKSSENGANRGEKELRRKKDRSKLRAYSSEKLRDLYQIHVSDICVALDNNEIEVLVIPDYELGDQGERPGDRVAQLKDQVYVHTSGEFVKTLQSAFASKDELVATIPDDLRVVSQDNSGGFTIAAYLPDTDETGETIHYFIATIHRRRRNLPYAPRPEDDPSLKSRSEDRISQMLPPTPGEAIEAQATTQSVAPASESLLFSEIPPAVGTPTYEVTPGAVAEVTKTREELEEEIWRIAQEQTSVEFVLEHTRENQLLDTIAKFVEEEKKAPQERKLIETREGNEFIAVVLQKKFSDVMNAIADRTPEVVGIADDEKILEYIYNTYLVLRDSILSNRNETAGVYKDVWGLDLQVLNKICPGKEHVDNISRRELVARWLWTQDERALQKVLIDVVNAIMSERLMEIIRRPLTDKEWKALGKKLDGNAGALNARMQKGPGWVEQKLARHPERNDQEAYWRDLSAIAVESVMSRLTEGDDPETSVLETAHVPSESEIDREYGLLLLVLNNEEIPQNPSEKEYHEILLALLSDEERKYLQSNNYLPSIYDQLYPKYNDAIYKIYGKRINRELTRVREKIAAMEKAFTALVHTYNHVKELSAKEKQDLLTNAANIVAERMYGKKSEGKAIIDLSDALIRKVNPKLSLFYRGETI